MKSTVYYHYIGGGASLSGIPTRDLTELEAKEFGVALLLGSKLYRKATRRRDAPEDDYLEEVINRDFPQTNDMEGTEKLD